ncbi:MAG: hypothetical protein ABR973_18350 [Candidatus Acidiferrales bacterium]
MAVPQEKLARLRTLITESLRVQLGGESITYVNVDHALEDARARQNHVIFARRGCGKSPSAEDRLPKSLHFAESDVIIGVVRAKSVHEVGYGHKWDWEA